MSLKCIPSDAESSGLSTSLVWLRRCLWPVAAALRRVVIVYLPLRLGLILLLMPLCNGLLLLLPVLLLEA